MVVVALAAVAVAAAVAVVPAKGLPGEPGVTVHPVRSVFWIPTRAARLASA
jgi:hypothetical protein